MTRRITVFAFVCAVVACATVAQAVPVFHLETSATAPQTPGLSGSHQCCPEFNGHIAHLVYQRCPAGRIELESCRNGRGHQVRRSHRCSQPGWPAATLGVPRRTSGHR